MFVFADFLPSYIRSSLKSFKLKVSFLKGAYKILLLGTNSPMPNVVIGIRLERTNWFHVLVFIVEQDNERWIGMQQVKSIALDL